MIPGTRTPDRWNADFQFNWDSIRSVWLNRIEFVRSLVGRVDLVIEKSPMLSVRASQLRQVFPESFFVILNRDPFASCSSFFHRYKDSSLDTQARAKQFETLASKWVERSKKLREAAETFGTATIRYEDFCDNPEACVSSLASCIPELASVDTKKPVKVKDYPEQGIQNQNPRQLAWLKDPDAGAIREVLSQEKNLLEYFGYALH